MQLFIFIAVWTYRVSHETWQLVNSFECLLPYIILDIKDFFQFISLTNSFTQIYFTLKSIFYKMTAMLYFLLFSFVSKNLTNYGRRHLKLFTNCHVSWDTLYVHSKSTSCIQTSKNCSDFFSFLNFKKVFISQVYWTSLCYKHKHTVHSKSVM